MTLEELLEKNRTFFPTFGPGFANHCSMGLLALLRTGADDERLNEFALKSFGHLEPIPAPSIKISGANFNMEMGRIQSFPAYLLYFKELHALNGSGGSVDKIVRDYLPLLMPGLAGGAFHPLIRLAYAIELADEAETIYSLAYFAASNGVLGAPPLSGERKFDPLSFLAVIRNNQQMRLKENSGLIYDRLEKAAALPGFTEMVNGINLSESDLPEIAKVVLEIYLSKENITTLHAVTGVHAFRLMMPYMEKTKTAILFLWRAVCALYISVGAPRLLDSKADNPSEWEEIKKEAVRSQDVHTIKFVYSCIEEERLYNNLSYKIAVSRKVFAGSEKG